MGSVSQCVYVCMCLYELLCVCIKVTRGPYFHFLLPSLTKITVKTSEVLKFSMTTLKHRLCLG